MIILQDTDAVNNWTRHKQFAVKVAALMGDARREYGLESRSERMSMCGNTVYYDVDEQGVLHYAGAWLCRDRLCPVCAWRLGIKRLGESIRTIDELVKREPRTKAIHIVLTVRNIPVAELRDQIKDMQAAFARLRKRQLWKDYILGYAKSVEVTYNEDKKTYHPHLHVVAIVPDTYIRQISYGDWVSLWRDCMRLLYNPVVYAKHAYKRPKDLREVTAWMDMATDVDDHRGDAVQAIIEAVKYQFKPEDLPDVATNAEIGKLALAIKGIRMVSYGGILARIRRDLKIPDEDAEVEQLPPEDIDPSQGVYRYRVIYTWATRAGVYVPHVESI